jgi:hypothetical protein
MGVQVRGMIGVHRPHPLDVNAQAFLKRKHGLESNIPHV